jgi:glutathione S-transferase
MKLYLNKTSPYARLVLATAHEAGIASRVETVWIEPWDDAPALLAVNPAAKVPALVTDDGVTLTESALLCEYLVGASGMRELLPEGPARADALSRYGLGRSAIDCSFSAVIQRRFNDGKETKLSERWVRALPRIAGVLDGVAEKRMGSKFDLGDLAVAVAFDYVSFRLGEVPWREKSPRLAAWVDAMCARESMKATQPS